jgi:hypothetical protein
VRLKGGGNGARVLAVALLVFARPAMAQIPLDSLPPDSTIVPPDSANGTALYLKAQAANQVRRPVLPLVGVDGPETPMSRIVLSRDSIDWSNAETLADLLQRVPGVFLWRGGWIGRPAYPNFRGRGPTSVDYYVDGLPYVPIGPDSLGIDPSLFPMSFIERVEIERWPEGMRVSLYTRRHDRGAVGSRIGISAGDAQVARYIGALEQRYKNGIGFAIGGERLASPTITGTSSNVDLNSLWLQAGYVPTTRFGVQAQLLQNSPNRDPYVSGTDTLDEKLKGTRRDEQFRVYWRQRKDEMGPRVDLLLGQTTWSGSGVDDKMRQGGIVTEWRTPTFMVGARAFNRSRLTPWDVSANAGWAPTRWASASVEAAYQTHDDNRTSKWVGIRGGLELPLGFQLSGTLRTGSEVAAPAILKNQAQDFTDWQALLGFQRKWAGLEVGYGRTSAFTPLPYWTFQPTIDSLRPSAQTEWVTFNARVTPLQWLTFEAWYSDPRGATPDGIPSTHSLGTATIRSKFWRSFPSGIYDFKLQGSMETWGPGVAGLDPAGAPIPIRGATFYRTLLEIQLDRFLLYWDRVNWQSTDVSYVPGFKIPHFGSTFGVRWEFSN